MAKPEWGVKRACPSCATRFYDLMRDPIVCPACGSTFALEVLAKPRRGKAAVPTPKAVETKVEDEDDEVLETDVEVDDEDGDDDVLELEDSDTTEDLPEVAAKDGDGDEEIAKFPSDDDTTSDDDIEDDDLLDDDDDDVSLESLEEDVDIDDEEERD